MRGRARPGRGAWLLTAGALLAMAACSEATAPPPPSATPEPLLPFEPAPAATPTRSGDQPGPLRPPDPSRPGPRPQAPTTGSPARSTAHPEAGTVVEVAYRLERRTADPATAGFEAFADATLADPRGWGRAGFRLVRRPDARFTVVLAEGPDVDALCLPYDTYGQYSCQNGPTVALNADRWRSATPKWTGTLEEYRRYLVGHEVGHLLGLRHPRTQCPAPGQPAPLMAQQSTELDGCLPNPWPLDDEVELGRHRPVDLAPPFRG